MKVHFRIDFEGLTNHIRDLWAEGSYWKCIETIDAAGVPREYWAKVIAGEYKLAQNPKGKNGVDGCLVKDKWKPDLNRCHYQRYPSYYELSSIFEKQQKWANQYFDTAYLEILSLWKEYNRTRYDGKKLYDIIYRLKQFPTEILEFAGVDMQRFLYEAEYNPINNKLEIDVDAFVKRQLELDKAPRPKPDPEFKIPTGYILPTGKFYSCGWMEHTWLASVLSNSQHFDKTMARSMGWIEISHPLNQPTNLKILFGDKEPTEAQLGTLAEWQLKYQGEIINAPGEW